MLADVYIWWIGADAPDDRLLEAVRETVERVYRVRGRLYRHHDRPTQAFDVRRGQHLSTSILRWLVDRGQPRGRVLAVTDVDLFIPVLTFVYGEAQLGGRAAVVSTARLAVMPGRDEDRAVSVDRVVKESVHELGHAFGLIHCETPECVMRRSVTLLDVDAKRPALCPACEVKYRALAQKGWTT
jgi:archaemetzincin